MQTLQITFPNALKAFNKAGDEGKKMLTDLFPDANFSKVKITDRINTWEDVLDYHNMTQADFDSKHSGLSPDTYAYEQIKLLVLALNEGENVKLENTGYYPYFLKTSSGRGLALFALSAATLRVRMSAPAFG